MRGFYICDEMQQLRDYLDTHGIDWHDNSDNLSEYQWTVRTVFEHDGKRVSVINGFCTYGGHSFSGENEGLLEIMFRDNIYDVKGWLTAREII